MKSKSPDVPTALCPKRRGGSNSNNFSIENLIAKDRDTEKCPRSGSDHCIEDEARSHSQSPNETLSPLSGSDQGSDFEESQRVRSSQPNHQDEIDLSDMEEGDERPGSYGSSTNNNSIKHGISSPLHNGIQSPGSLRSNSNSGPATPSPVLKSCPTPPNSTAAAVMTANSLLPVYPFYAAAFLSAQSLLYNNSQYFPQRHGGIPMQFSNYPFMTTRGPNNATTPSTIHHPQTAMLFNTKDLSSG